MNKVLVVISDTKYLEHSKYLFESALSNGKWTDDLCLIANNVDDKLLDDFKKIGIHIIHINISNKYYSKYFLFDVKMLKWDYVVYMDCDFTIFDDLNIIICDELENLTLYVDRVPFRLHESFCQGWNNDIKYQTLTPYYSEYDFEKFGFNAGFISFNTSIISSTTLSDILLLSDKLQPLNNHTSPEGSDEPILNLYFINNIKFIEDKKVSSWKDATENTITQHHCRWESPWTNNEYCNRLGAKYITNYQNKLINFNTRI